MAAALSPDWLCHAHTLRLSGHTRMPVTCSLYSPRKQLENTTCRIPIPVPDIGSRLSRLPADARARRSFFSALRILLADNEIGASWSPLIRRHGRCVGALGRSSPLKGNMLQILVCARPTVPGVGTWLSLEIAPVRTEMSAKSEKTLANLRRWRHDDHVGISVQEAQGGTDEGSRKRTRPHR